MVDRIACGAVAFGTMLLSAAACVSSSGTSEQQPDYLPRLVVEIERYDILHSGTVLGAVVLLEIEDPSGPLRFWRIENRNGAWVGHATAVGRFSRRVPFRDDEQDLGIWPMRKGVARLLEVDGSVELRPAPVAVPAAARRPR
jgi:hypothetical protein